MFCIMSLPRTASKFTWHLINHTLSLDSIAHMVDTPETPFNPRYVTSEEDLENRYRRIMAMNPLPVLKIITNHNFDLAQRIIDEKKYKTIRIDPYDLKKQILNVLVSKKVDSFNSEHDRREVLEQHKGTIVITPDEIRERIRFYERHKLLKCDYTFYDANILADPAGIMSVLGMKYTGTNYHRIAPAISNEDMLRSVDEWESAWNEAQRSW